MNTLIISIGSNENSLVNIRLCRIHLYKLFDIIYFSAISVTKPFGDHYQRDFLNQLAIVRTTRELDELNLCLKELEQKIGRKKEDKANGSVKIDIDIVKWNDTILKQNDWERDYVADLLPSLYDNASLD